MNPSFADNSFAQWPDIPNGHRPTLPPYLGDLRLTTDPLKVDRPPGVGSGTTTSSQVPPGRPRLNAVQQDTCPCRRLRPVGAVVSTRANDEALGTLSKYRRWRAKAPLSLSSMRDGLPGRVSDSTAEKPGLAAHYGAQTMAQPPEPAAKIHPRHLDVGDDRVARRRACHLGQRLSRPRAPDPVPRSRARLLRSPSCRPRAQMRDCRAG